MADGRPTTNGTAVLEIDGLALTLAGGAPLVEDVSLSVGEGEVVALVGESGSGKSVTAKALLGLLPPAIAASAGQVRICGEEVLGCDETRLRRIRGKAAGLIFQQPKAMLDPTCRIGTQVGQPLRVHGAHTRGAAWAEAVRLLDAVGIPAPAERAAAYAHELSGGMAQRAMIAAALANSPALLVADEPTTALDVTVQAQILQLLAGERRKRKLAVLLITHDFTVVSAIADRVAVMYAGRIVETGSTEAVLGQPRHPYTVGLVRAARMTVRGDGTFYTVPSGEVDARDVSRGCRFLPRCGVAGAAGVGSICATQEPILPKRLGHCARCHATPEAAMAQLVEPPLGPERCGQPPGEPPLLRLLGVRKRFLHRRTGFRSRAFVHAVRDLSLMVLPGEVLGLAGESGCGKSTLARIVTRQIAADAGTVTFDGQDVAALRGPSLAAYRRSVQLVFQDPLSSLDPKMRLGDALDAPLAQHRAGRPNERRARVRDMLATVGLEPALLERFPHQCSGGELQRAVIARALLLQPRLLIADEPTSAVDPSIRAQVLNLLTGLKRSLGLTLLHISHDLRAMQRFCDRIAVMYLGRIVEVAPAQQLFSAPAHPYTRALVAAATLDDIGLEAASGKIAGEVPSPLDPPAGCGFHPRCPVATGVCSRADPPETPVAAGHTVRCHNWQGLQSPNSRAASAPGAPAAKQG